MATLAMTVNIQIAYSAPQDDITSARTHYSEEQRQQRLQQQNLPQKDHKPISTQELQSITDGGFVLDETPCFYINEIQLVDEHGEVSKTAKKFNFARAYAKRKSGFKSGMCLGEKSISHLILLVQNKIIDKGYTTTQVGLMPQDLNSGNLNIAVIAGHVGEVKYQNCDNTKGSKIATMALPSRNDDTAPREVVSGSLKETQSVHHNNGCSVWGAIKFPYQVARFLICEI